MSGTKAAGVVLALVGVAWYSYCKYQEGLQQAAPAQLLRAAGGPGGGGGQGEGQPLLIKAGAAGAAAEQRHR
jgi:hypothetical protein